MNDQNNTKKVYKYVYQIPDYTFLIVTRSYEKQNHYFSHFQTVYMSTNLVCVANKSNTSASCPHSGKILNWELRRKEASTQHTHTQKTNRHTHTLTLSHTPQMFGGVPGHITAPASWYSHRHCPSPPSPSLRPPPCQFFPLKPQNLLFLSNSPPPPPPPPVS